MSAADQERYMAALHAMQSGVMFEHNVLRSKDGSPKHLRVGVNSALITGGALARLLIEKGICTTDEFEKTVADMAEEEVAAYEQRAADSGYPQMRFH